MTGPNSIRTWSNCAASLVRREGIQIRRRLLCAILGSLLLLTSGCWEYRKLNALALVLGMALDQTEKGDVQVTLQFPLPSVMKGGGQGGGQGGGGGKQFFTVKGVGPSVAEALADAHNRLSRPMSFGHLQVVLLSEEVGRAGRGDILEQLWRFAELDKLSHVMVVSGGDASDALEVVPPQERLPALYLTTVMQTLARSKTQAKPSTLLDGLVISREPGRDFLVTVVETESNETLKINRLAVFRRAQLVTLLSPEETNSVLLALGEIQNLSVSVEGKDGNTYVVRRMRATKADLSVETRGGTDHLVIALRVASEAAGALGPGLRIDHRTMAKMEEAVSELLEKRVTETVQRLQQLEVDPIGFYARRSPPLANDETWRKRYRQAKLRVAVHVIIQRKGTVE